MFVPPATKMPFKMHAKFSSILMFHFYRFFIDFGRVLGGFWEPCWPPRCIKNALPIFDRCELIFYWFLVDFCLLFHWFLKQLGNPEPLKMKLSFESGANLQHFGKLLLDGLLGSILTPTWCQLGSILGGFWMKKWSKIDPKGIKNLTKTMSKIWYHF